MPKLLLILTTPDTQHPIPIFLATAQSITKPLEDKPMLKLLKSALKTIFPLPSRIELMNDLDEMMEFQSELMDDNKGLATRNSELMAENLKLIEENNQLLEENLRLTLKQPTDINQEFDSEDLAVIEQLVEKCQQLEDYNFNFPSQG